MSAFSDKSPYSYYLDLLGQWPTNIALVSQWLVYFDFTPIIGNDALMGNIQSNLNSKEPESEWGYNSNVTSYLLDGKLQTSTDNMMGCVFARQVDLPAENIIAGNEGLSYGGYLPPATSSNRAKYEPLGITMLETNASFLDFIIRPWVLSVGYYGLIARKPNTRKYVKCRYIDVVMFSKAGANIPMQVRKIYRFYNAAPINIPSETYSYAEESLRYSNVKFVYDSYAVSDGNSGNLIALP